MHKSTRLFPVAVLTLVTLAAILGGRTASSQQGGSTKVRSVSTVGGVLSITQQGPAGLNPIGQQYIVRLAGKTIATYKDVVSVRLYSYNARYEGGDTVIISISAGGNACPAQFRIVHIKSPTSYHITEEFGDCSEEPTVRADQRRLEMTFPGYYRLSQLQEPGFRKPSPTTFVYRDAGKIKKLNPTKK